MNPLRLLPLLGASLRRRTLRTLLTLASTVVAFLLFGLLAALRQALAGGVEIAGADRLMTMHKGSFILLLPRSYLARVAALPGVLAVNSQRWLGGYVSDPRNLITAMVVDADSFAAVYPEIIVPPAQLRDWQSDPRSALVGKALARANGWKIGDTIPLQSSIFRRQDQSNAWPVRLAAIYDMKNGADTSSLFIHYRYFNETTAFTRDQIGWLVVRVKDAARMTQLARTIDALFANSPDETNTSDERTFIQSFINQFGNIGKIIALISAAVFFTLLLVTANTMARSVRERTAEIAVLKTLGFKGGQVTGLVLAEALLIVLLGAGLGMLLATGAAAGVRHRFDQYFPLFAVTASAWLLAAGFALLLGLLSAAMPAWQAWRLRIVDALQRG